MHFPIIKLETPDTLISDWCIDLDPLDATLCANTDYFGEIYDTDERREVIKSEWLKNLFDGIAKIDTVKETITFLNPDQIEITLANYFIKLTGDLYVEAKKKKLRWYDIQEAAKNYKHFDTLFYLERGYTSFDFIDDAKWYAGQTFVIGNIFDAHI